MQHFKHQFSDENYFNTLCNIQKCLRLNDLDEVGDGTHYLDFDMIGLFSFRQLSVKNSIDFFMEFLGLLNIKPDYVTIHPDKILEWSPYYSQYNIDIRPETDCLWSDGNIGGYCTEFFKDNIEIGNIVNPLGNCIDVGFGLERLIMVHNKELDTKRLEILERSCQSIIDSGIGLGHFKESFILKKIITTCIYEGSNYQHEYFSTLKKNMIVNYKIYLRTKHKKHLINKDSSYWKNSLGIDINNLEFYDKLLREENHE